MGFIDSKTFKTREYYKGKSFNWAGNWAKGNHYNNDDWVIDFVVYNNAVLACKESHTAVTPPELVSEGKKIVGVNSQEWFFVMHVASDDAINEGVTGIEYDPNKGALTVTYGTGVIQSFTVGTDKDAVYTGSNAPADSNKLWLDTSNDVPEASDKINTLRKWNSETQKWEVALSNAASNIISRNPDLVGNNKKGYITAEEVLIENKGKIDALETKVQNLPTSSGIKGQIKDGTITIGDSSITPLTSASEINADKITGMIPLSNIPAAALERLIHVGGKDERFKLTKDKVQVGDTVQDDDTGIMYRVVDDSKLNEDAGYVAYVAGTAAKASSVPWSGVTGKPKTYTPSAHQHEISDINGLEDRLNGIKPGDPVTSLSWDSITGKPNFHKVATSGSYNDLTNRPTLFSGAYSDLSGTPTLSTVATTGNYNDLSNAPTSLPANGGNADTTDGHHLGVTITEPKDSDKNKVLLSDGTWSNNIPVNAATATKLAKSVKLWGRTFDGSSDISGELNIDTTKLSYDTDYKALHVSTPLYTNDWVSVRGANPEAGADSSEVKMDLLKKWADYNPDTAGNKALGAELGYQIKTILDELIPKVNEIALKVDSEPVECTCEDHTIETDIDIDSIQF